jgi:hypothetical protein
LLENWRLYLRYMSVGVAAIPGGIAYGILAVHRYDRWWTALPSIALGLALGRMAWRYFDLKQRTEIQSSSASNIGGVDRRLSYSVPAYGLAAGVFIFSIVYAQAGTRNVLQNQIDQDGGRNQQFLAEQASDNSLSALR